MARSRHEVPRQNTFRRSRGSIEGCLEAPINGHSHNTQTQPIRHTQSKHWHCSMNQPKRPPNMSTPALCGGTMAVFEHAQCSLKSMESMHSIDPFHPSSSILINIHSNTISPLVAACAPDGADRHRRGAPSRCRRAVRVRLDGVFRCALYAR